MCVRKCSADIILLSSSLSSLSSGSEQVVSDNKPCQQTVGKMAVGNHCWTLYHNIHKKRDVDISGSSVI